MNKPITLWIPTELKDDLQRVAKTEDRSMSSMVRVILESYLEKKHTDEKREARKNTA